MLDFIELANANIPQYMNVHRAMRLGGFKKYETLLAAIEGGEIKIKRSLLENDDPSDPKSWIQIDSYSFFQWMRKQSILPIKETQKKYDNITRSLIQGFTNNEVKLGFLQHEINILKVRITEQQQTIIDNNRLIRSLIALLVKEPQNTMQLELYDLGDFNVRVA